MKFEEKGARLYNYNHKNHNTKGYIYFLMKDEEVVYIGQTCRGIERPLSHRDKDFDNFYMKPVSIELLDKKEREYILKYNPIYNKNYENDETLIPITKFNEELHKLSLSIRSSYLKMAIIASGTRFIHFNQNTSIFTEDKRKLIDWIQKEYEKIIVFQDKSFNIKSDNREELEFRYFLMKVYNYGIACINDFIYMGVIEKSDMVELRKIFDSKKFDDSQIKKISKRFREKLNSKVDLFKRFYKNTFSTEG